MSEVFLSYANADRERAVAIAELLRLGGYSVWWDPPSRQGACLTRCFRKLSAPLVALSCCGRGRRWRRTGSRPRPPKGRPARYSYRPPRGCANPDRVPPHSSGEPQGWNNNPDDPEFQRLMQSIGRLLHSAAQGVAPRLDAHAPGSVVARTRRVTYRAMARLAWIPALVAASFFMGWVSLGQVLRPRRIAPRRECRPAGRLCRTFRLETPRPKRCRPADR